MTATVTPMVSVEGLVKVRSQSESVFELHVPRFTVLPGQMVAVVGESGCGKSTLLDILALVMVPTRVALFRIDPGGGPAWDVAALWEREDEGALARLRRDSFGYVLQTGGLLPFLSVRGNICLPGRLKGAEIPAGRLEALSRRLGIEGCLERMPLSLSIGQRQRVAMGRAIVREPRAFLMDEPLSNLDARLRVQMRGEIVRLQARLGATMVYVTHDQVEALTMGRRVAVMDAGRIRQCDTPAALYERPADTFVARFIGHGMLLPVQADAAGKLQSALGELPGQHAANSRQLLLRSHDLQYDPTAPVHARLLGSSYQGSHQIYTLELADGTTVQATMPAGLQHVAGEMIGVRLQQDRELVVFAG